MKASPPMPVMFGSVTLSTAAIAIGRIDGVAAALQDVEAGLRRQRLARRDHRMAGPRRRPPGLDAREPVVRRLLSLHRRQTSDRHRRCYSVSHCHGQVLIAGGHRRSVCLTWLTGEASPPPVREAPPTETLPRRPHVLPRSASPAVAEILAAPARRIHQLGDDLGIRPRPRSWLPRIGVEIVERQLDLPPHVLAGQRRPSPAASSD